MSEAATLVPRFTRKLLATYYDNSQGRTLAAAWFSWASKVDQRDGPSPHRRSQRRDHLRETASFLPTPIQEQGQCSPFWAASQLPPGSTQLGHSRLLSRKRGVLSSRVSLMPPGSALSRKLLPWALGSPDRALAANSAASEPLSPNAPNPPVIEVSGRTSPVGVRYRPAADAAARDGEPRDQLE